MNNLLTLCTQSNLRFLGSGYGSFAVGVLADLAEEDDTAGSCRLTRRALEVVAGKSIKTLAASLRDTLLAALDRSACHGSTDAVGMDAMHKK